MALFAGYELAVRSPTQETASAPFPTHRKNGRRGITVTHRRGLNGKREPSHTCRAQPEEPCSMKGRKKCVQFCTSACHAKRPTPLAVIEVPTQHTRGHQKAATCRYPRIACTSQYESSLGHGQLFHFHWENCWLIIDGRRLLSAARSGSGSNGLPPLKACSG